MNVRKVSRAIASSLRMTARDAALNVVPASALVPTFLRYLIYRIIGLDVHTFKIYPRCFFGGTQVSIGSGTFVSYECFFDASAFISIGNGCVIGAGAVVRSDCETNCLYAGVPARFIRQLD